MPDDEHIITVQPRSSLNILLDSYVNIGSPIKRVATHQNIVDTVDNKENANGIINENTKLARSLIDKIFDIELKKEALVKAIWKYQVNVEESLLVNLDQKLYGSLSKFLSLFEPVTISD